MLSILWGKNGKKAAASGPGRLVGGKAGLKRHLFGAWRAADLEGALL